jgi:hypothetical protein
MYKKLYTMSELLLGSVPDNSPKVISPTKVKFTDTSFHRMDSSSTEVSVRRTHRQRIVPVYSTTCDELDIQINSRRDEVF